MNTSVLLIMAKKPVVGSTKTRLCPPLTTEEAAELYEALLLDTIDKAYSLEEIELAIAITPSNSAPYFERIAPEGTIFVPVDCDNIGQCLNKGLKLLLERGYNKALAINSDGPSLPSKFIHDGFSLLKDHDLVFGPSEDGGYYLVGLKKGVDEIFSGIAWSTSRVLSQSLKKCEDLNLKVALLPYWYDVDTVKDLERLREELKSLPEHALVYSRKVLGSINERYSEELGS